MGEVKVKHQSASTRCEICHQADCFDPVNDFCSRCADIYQQENLAVMLRDSEAARKSMPFAFPNLLRAGSGDRFLLLVFKLAIGFFSLIIGVLSGLQALINLQSADWVRWYYLTDFIRIVTVIFLKPIIKALEPIFSLFYIGPLESLVYISLIFIALSSYLLFNLWQKEFRTAQQITQ